MTTVGRVTVPASSSTTSSSTAVQDRYRHHCNGTAADHKEETTFAALDDGDAGNDDGN
jgi:hypothetical protein